VNFNLFRGTVYEICVRKKRPKGSSSQVRNGGNGSCFSISGWHWRGWGRKKKRLASDKQFQWPKERYKMWRSSPNPYERGSKCKEPFNHKNPSNTRARRNKVLPKEAAKVANKKSLETYREERGETPRLGYINSIGCRKQTKTLWGKGWKHPGES